MVYRKRKNYRKKCKGRGYLSTAAKALSIAYGVKKLLNIEYKSLVTTLAVDPGAAGAVTNIIPVAIGDDFDDRDGRKIKLVSIKIKGQVTMNASASDSLYRLLIVRDNNGSTTQPAITDLFTSVAIFHQNNNKLGDPQSNSRFSVLSDTWYTLNASNGTKREINIYIPISSHVFFSGSGATDEGKGAIYAFQASNEGTNDPVCNVDCMVKWIDN